MEDNLRYEDNEDFNLSLDEPGDVLIAETPFKRSFILFELDPLLYQSTLEEFKAQRLENLKQAIFDEFPACIAYNLRLSEKGAGSNDPVKKLLHLKDTWESLIFVLYAMLMGEIRKKEVDLQGAKSITGTVEQPFNTEKILTDRLKIKISNIRGIIRYCIANNVDLKFNDYVNEPMLDTISELQDIRNDLSHHAAPTKEQAEEELNQVRPLFEKLLPTIEFLKDCKFIRFENHQAKTRFETFNGHSLNREFDEFQLQTDIITYVLANQSDLFMYWGNDIFSLSPFLHYTPDSTGHESYLCFFKGKRNSKFYYEPVKHRTELTFDALNIKFDSEKVVLQRLLIP